MYWEITYVFHNAACFPPEPVDNSSDPAGFVVQKALRIDIFSSQDLDLSAWPDGTEEVKGSVRAVVSEWVMVLQRVSKLLCCKAGDTSRTI